MNANFAVIVSLLLIASIAASDPAQAVDCDRGSFEGAFAGEVLVPQNWNCEERQTFWFIDQGSRIMPYSWFLHLEQADSGERFADPRHLDRFRYLPQGPTGLNPDGLPIGFTRGLAVAGSENEGISGEWLGMNCAACHTGQIEYGGAKYLIDGAPALADFQGFFKGLAQAMQATLDDDAKFGRFAEAVIAETASSGDGGTTDEAALHAQLQLVTDRRHEWNGRNQGSSPYGHARLDAVGSIFNEVAAAGLDTPGNAQPANAPVSYPFIWDTPQHDFVQWNGSIHNPGLGALSRNVGEVLGVFGTLKMNNDPSRPTGHDHSIDINGLAALEDHLIRLWSPRWKDTDLPDIDEALAEKGREDFETYCLSCHADIDRDDPARKIEARMFPVYNPKNDTDPDALRTDPTMAENFLERTVSAVKLIDRPLGYLAPLSAGKTFTAETADATKTIQVLGYAVVGTVTDTLIEDPQGTIEALKVGQSKAFQDAVDQAAGKLFAEPGEAGFTKFLIGLGDALQTLPLPSKTSICVVQNENAVPCYKARPLNGIWATAPYLHNGSVRTLRQLLLPSDQRDKVFKVGSRAFDADGIGFVNEGATVLDTSLPGNANGGHDGPQYGNDVFADDPKRMDAILEYLKTL